LSPFYGSTNIIQNTFWQQYCESYFSVPENWQEVFPVWKPVVYFVLLRDMLKREPIELTLDFPQLSERKEIVTIHMSKYLKGTKAITVDH
jgi:hypothetical protein